jgi:hypothetical protein
MRITLTWVLLFGFLVHTSAIAGSSIGTMADNTSQPKQPPASHEPIAPQEPPTASNKSSLFTTKTVIILAASTLVTAGLGVGLLYFLVKPKDQSPTNDSNLPNLPGLPSSQSR